MSAADDADTCNTKLDVKPELTEDHQTLSIDAALQGHAEPGDTTFQAAVVPAEAELHCQAISAPTDVKPDITVIPTMAISTDTILQESLSSEFVVKQEIVALEATISRDEDIGATPKAEILPELQHDRAAPIDVDLQAKTVPEMQHSEPICPVVNLEANDEPTLWPNTSVSDSELPNEDASSGLRHTAMPTAVLLPDTAVPDVVPSPETAMPTDDKLTLHAVGSDVLQEKSAPEGIVLNEEAVPEDVEVKLDVVPCDTVLQYETKPDTAIIQDPVPSNVEKSPALEAEVDNSGTDSECTANVVSTETSKFSAETSDNDKALPPVAGGESGLPETETGLRENLSIFETETQPELAIEKTRDDSATSKEFMAVCDETKDASDSAVDSGDTGAERHGDDLDLSNSWKSVDQVSDSVASDVIEDGSSPHTGDV